MSLKFTQVKLHDRIDLPGRRGQADHYVIIWKHNNRLKLESLLEKGQMRYLTENQFNDAGFEPVLEQSDGIPA